MQSDNISKHKKQSVKSDFSVNGKVISLLNFLEKYLPEFPTSIHLKENTNEEIINQKLLRFLLTKNTIYNFIAENRDETGENKSKPDLGVYEKVLDKNGIEVYDDNQIRFFDIECKRLYHKTNSKQYVTGTTGGIQRFKENKHGVDLPYSAMIGYIEIENFNFWQTKVNSWILDKNEHLKILEINTIAKLKSKHVRIKEKTPITLIHYWISLN